MLWFELNFDDYTENRRQTKTRKTFFLQSADQQFIERKWGQKCPWKDL